MDQEDLEMEVKSYSDSLPLEPALKHLWERVRAVADRVSQLQEENNAFRNRVEELEREVARLHSELVQREQETKRMKQEHAHLTGPLGDNNFLKPEEREALKTRIKELIAKINSHL